MTFSFSAAALSQTKIEKSSWPKVSARFSCPETAPSAQSCSSRPVSARKLAHPPPGRADRAGDPQPNNQSRTGIWPGLDRGVKINYWRVIVGCLKWEYFELR